MRRMVVVRGLVVRVLVVDLVHFVFRPVRPHGERRERVRQLHLTFDASEAAIYPFDRRQQYLKLKLAGFDAAPVHLAVFCDEKTTQGPVGRELRPTRQHVSAASSSRPAPT